MSIVIAFLLPKSGFYLYGDKRARNKNTDLQLTDVKKIFIISETITLGITGHYEWGMSVLNMIRSSSLVQPSKIIDCIKRFPINNSVAISTIVLGGKYDNGEAFMWTYMTQNAESNLIIDDASFSICVEPQELSIELTQAFNRELGIPQDLEIAFSKTILLASQRKPKSISPDYDSLAVKLY